MSKKIIVIHGPNLNLLGTREPEIYGSTTLEELNASLIQTGSAQNVDVECIQLNGEKELIEAVQQARETTDGLIINPAGYSHTSVALRDALAMYDKPSVEVHISNIYQREPFRHHSFVSGVVSGVISGLGTNGYLAALHCLFGMVNAK